MLTILAVLFSLHTFAQVGPNASIALPPTQPPEQSVPEVSKPTVNPNSDYAQMQQLFNSATESIAVTDFDKIGSNSRRVCYQTSESNPDIPTLTGVYRFVKIIGEIRDKQGVIIPEQDIYKVMVGLYVTIDQFDQYQDLAVTGNQIVSVGAGQTYTFRKSADRIVYRVELPPPPPPTGTDKKLVTFAYGLCIHPQQN